MTFSQGCVFHFDESEFVITIDVDQWVLIYLGNEYFQGF